MCCKIEINIKTLIEITKTYTSFTFWETTKTTLSSTPESPYSTCSPHTTSAPQYTCPPATAYAGHPLLSQIDSLSPSPRWSNSHSSDKSPAHSCGISLSSRVGTYAKTSTNSRNRFEYNPLFPVPSCRFPWRRALLFRSSTVRLK